MDQRTQFANLNALLQCVDETALTWDDVSVDAFIGFSVVAAEAGLGPDGVTVLVGCYPILDPNTLYELDVFFSDGETDPLPAGLHYRRAQLPLDIVDGRCDYGR